jgi:sortase (surface protein transpeptidase)
MIYKPLTPIEPIEVPIINPTYGDFVTVSNQMTKQSETVAVTVSEDSYSFSLDSKFYEAPSQYDYEIFYYSNNSKVTVQVGILQIGEIEIKNVIYNTTNKIITYNG